MLRAAMTLADRLAEGGEGVREPASAASASPAVPSSTDSPAVAPPWAGASPLTADEPALPVRFAADLPATLQPEDRDALLARLGAHGPWGQGPFVLAGDLCVGDRGTDHRRWAELAPEIAEDLPGRRVLDVGSDAGYDSFMFARLGAAGVVGVEDGEAHAQAMLLESTYRTGVDFRRLGWHQLDPADLGQFDIVHCHNTLCRELNPVALLEALRPLLRDGGTLLLGTMVLTDPERSDCIRLVPTGLGGDPSWRMVPGRLALRWMLRAAGFTVRDELAMSSVPGGELRVVDGYVRCVAAQPATPSGPRRS